MSIYTDSPVIEVNTHGLYVEEALKAVDKAVDREVEYEVKTATNRIIRDIEKEIAAQVKTEVEKDRIDIEAKVSKEIEKQVSNIDLTAMKKDIKERASTKIMQKFDGNLNDILDNFNSNLTNVQKIYSSIAKSITREDSGKEMTFKIS